MTPRTRKLMLFFAALGLGASSLSAYVHYQLLTDPSYSSFCDVKATLSCTQAYLSAYSSVLGVPVALGGVVFFALVLLLAGLGARAASAARQSAADYIVVLSTVGLAAVLFLGWASYFRLHTLCVLCMATYVAVFAIFGLSLGTASLPIATLPARAARDLRELARSPVALLLLLLLAAGVGLALAAFPAQRGTSSEAAAYPPLTDQQRADLRQWWTVQPKVDLPIPADGAKVLVVKFSDYMCPACRQTYEAYKPVFAKYLPGGQVRYVVKHYPLEPECNPNVTINHFASCEAAAAVIMARGKGTAPALEQWLFTNQETLSPDTVKRAAKEVGGIQDFDAQYSRALEEVSADAALGGRLGVSSTPTFYINGRKMIGPPPQYFDYLIALALEDAK